MNLTYSPTALAALDAIYEYHEESDRAAARRLVERITFSGRMIEKFPLMAPEVGDGTRRFSIPRTPYRMIYTISDDTVVVLDLQHERMQFPRSE